MISSRRPSSRSSAGRSAFRISTRRRSPRRRTCSRGATTRTARSPLPSTRPPAADARVGAGTMRRSTALLFSVLLRPPAEAALPQLSLVAGLAVATAVESECSASAPWSSGRTTCSWRDARSRGSCSRRPARWSSAGSGSTSTRLRERSAARDAAAGDVAADRSGSLVRPGSPARGRSRRARATLRRLGRRWARGAAATSWSGATRFAVSEFASATAPGRRARSLRTEG